APFLRIFASRVANHRSAASTSPVFEYVDRYLDERRDPRSQGEIMKKMILPLVLLVLLAGGWWEYRKYKSPNDLVLSGSIEARDVEVGSLVGGRVAKVLVQEGSQVKAGDLIVTLDSGLLDLQIREQEGRVKEAQANYTRALK